MIIRRKVKTTRTSSTSHFPSETEEAQLTVSLSRVISPPTALPPPDVLGVCPVACVCRARTPRVGTKQDLIDIKERARRKEPVSAAKKPVLLVCPSSVLSGWEDHFARWGFFECQSITSSGGTGKGSIEVGPTHTKGISAWILGCWCICESRPSISAMLCYFFVWRLASPSPRISPTSCLSSAESNSSGISERSVY